MAATQDITSKTAFFDDTIKEFSSITTSLVVSDEMKLPWGEQRATPGHPNFSEDSQNVLKMFTALCKFSQLCILNIIGMKKTIKELKDISSRIQHIHPLKQIVILKNNQEILIQIQKIIKASFSHSELLKGKKLFYNKILKNFYKNYGIAFQTNDSADNLEKFISDFAQETGLEEGALRGHLISARITSNWNDFAQYCFKYLSV